MFLWQNDLIVPCSGNRPAPLGAKVRKKKHSERKKRRIFFFFLDMAGCPERENALAQTIMNAHWHALRTIKAEDPVTEPSAFGGIGITMPDKVFGDLIHLVVNHLEAAIWHENLWHAYALGGLVVLQYRGNDARQGKSRTVEGVAKLNLLGV